MPKQPLQITVTYRQTSRLSMRIGKKGNVLVSAPYGTPKQVIHDFLDSHAEWIEKALASAKKRAANRLEFFNRLPLHNNADCQAVLDRLNALIPPLVDKYSRQMGVAPSAITYRATISRWGCCNVNTGVVQYSAYLLLLPEWCIESVVVHELVHLLVPNHGPEFYALMDKHFPRWREARAEIKRIAKNDMEE